MKKAQIAGQIFIYIMAVLVIGAIALIGYNAIGTTIGKGCQVEQTQFIQTLNSLMDKHSSPGSENKEQLTAPCEFDTLCFVDASAIGSATFNCHNGIVNVTIHSGVQKNVFVVSSKATAPIGYSPLIKTNNTQQCECIKQRNRNFYIKFTGMGSRTKIEGY